MSKSPHLNPTQKIAKLAITAIGIFISLSSSAQPAATVVVSTVEQQAIFQQLKITGTVTSPHAAQLSAETNGLIATLFVEEGDHVQTGDKLLQLDDTLATQQLQSDKAKTIRATAELNNAKRKFKEAQEVGKQRGIAETQIRDLEAAVAISEASLAQANADEAYQQAIVDKHQLEAPFNGVIHKKLADVGEWLTPGKGVLELIATDELRLDFAVAEDYLRAINNDSASIDFSVKALGEQSYAARVQRIVPVSDPEARTFLLRATPEVAISQLAPGMSVNAVLNIPLDRTALVIPRDAAIRQPDGRLVVWTAKKEADGHSAVENVVQIGQSFNDRLEISSGLSHEALVIIRGNETLQNGQRIQFESH